MLTPAEPPDPERTLEDADSSLRSYENRTLSGDKFLDNLYERPFTSLEMVYQPELDITLVDFSYDDDFFYFTLHLYGLDAETGTLNGLYGIEFDRTKTGRGDLLVQVQDPMGEWSTENVNAYADADGDVGGPKPILSDEGFSGNGYDTQLAFSGDKAAYARIAPDDAEAVQFAISKALLDDAPEFLWGAWADGVLKDITRFDYNDTMSQAAAGSPIRDSGDYPIKDLYSLDSTCRLPYGVKQGDAIYFGMCYSIPKEIKTKSEDGTSCYCTQPCATHAGCCGQIVCN